MFVVLRQLELGAVREYATLYTGMTCGISSTMIVVKVMLAHCHESDTSESWLTRKARQQRALYAPLRNTLAT
eukprot:189567-Amphidinium_carterae.1